eukprot:3948086-Pyramimonas_sp.AAC.1
MTKTGVTAGCSCAAAMRAPSAHGAQEQIPTTRPSSSIAQVVDDGSLQGTCSREQALITIAPAAG